MNWSAEIDAYCERLGPGFWAEPVNAVTNAAFLIVAALMWRRLRGSHLSLARALVVVLAAIGVGSFLFHTLATVWSGLADVLPIALFILLYLFAACRDFMGLSGVRAVAATAGFALLAVLGAYGLSALVPDLGANAGYIAVDVLILCFGLGFLASDRRLGAGLFAGGAMLALSINARMLDPDLCAVWPVGTHFLWHLINAAVLGWMIEVYRRHMLAGAAAPG